MSDEKLDPENSSILANAVNSQPFVPNIAPSLSQRRNSSTNVDAKPFVPASARPNGSLTADAKPFQPSTTGEGSRTKGFSASAAPYIPGQPPSSGRALQHQRPASPGLDGGGDRGRSVLAEYKDPSSMTPYSSAAVDSRHANSSMTYSSPYPGPRPLNTAYAGGRGRGRSPNQTPPLSPYVPQYGGGAMPAKLHPMQRPPPDVNGRGGRGRGRGLSGAGMYGGSHPGFPRNHSHATAPVEQLLSGLQKQSYLVNAQMTPEMQAELQIPDMLQQFHTLYPLEDLKARQDAISSSLGVHSSVLKGVSIEDGEAYALRKLNWRQVPPSPDLLVHANEVSEAWSAVQSQPNLSVPRQAFLGMEPNGQPALHLVHDYHPGAVTLEAAHLQPQQTANGLIQVAATEDAMWQYLLQLAAGLQAVHSVGLACRYSMHLTKILLLPGGRLRIGTLGATEIITGSAARQDEMMYLQQEDLKALGRVLLQLACGNARHFSLDYCAAHFSPDLTHIIACLLGHHEAFNNCHQLMTAVKDQAFGELDNRALFSDAVTSQLAKEIENGRLLRLSMKLSMVLERSDMESHWSETGDRYLLKLFRDFVFHQVSETGAPMMDWAHMVEAMNKLDAGVPEKIVLLSRDEASMLVVSYADLKRCLENTVAELKKLASMTYAPASESLRY